MINLIIGAVSAALDAEFGDGYSIYAEGVPQNLERPCFFISSIHSDSVLYPSKRHKRRNQFAVQYFPVSDKNARQECLDTAERLLVCLERVTAADGTGFLEYDTHYEITDGVLHYFTNYNFFTRKRKDLDRMENMRQSFRQKG